MPLYIHDVVIVSGLVTPDLQQRGYCGSQRKGHVVA